MLRYPFRLCLLYSLAVPVCRYKLANYGFCRNEITTTVWKIASVLIRRLSVFDRGRHLLHNIMCSNMNNTVHLERALCRETERTMFLVKPICMFRTLARSRIEMFSYKHYVRCRYKIIANMEIYFYFPSSRAAQRSAQSSPHLSFAILVIVDSHYHFIVLFAIAVCALEFFITISATVLPFSFILFGWPATKPHSIFANLSSQQQNSPPVPGAVLHLLYNEFLLSSIAGSLLRK